ncbi:hypothetical protein Tco_0394751 [Tanacetum coccineum]
MILSGIKDDIYSTVDACTTAKEIWIAIETGESFNKQDVKTNLLWEFGKFTSRDGESIESYYSRFYKMMNEMIKKKLEVTTMQVNVQFLQQLQLEWHFAKECIKPKREKDYAYHKEKMILCKQEERSVPLSAEQDQWLYDTDEEPDEQELEAHYMYMAKIQELLTADSRPTHDAEPLEQQPKSINDTYVVETIDSNVILNSSDMCDNKGKDDQNSEDHEDERVVLANLITNLKLNYNENKKIQKKLKKANASVTHELNECKYALKESNGIQDRCSSALHDQDIKLEKYKKYKNCQLVKEEVERTYKDTLGLLA